LGDGDCRFPRVPAGPHSFLPSSDGEHSRFAEHRRYDAVRFAAHAARIVGAAKDLPADLSTNPKRFEGFGES